MKKHISDSMNTKRQNVLIVMVKDGLLPRALITSPSRRGAKYAMEKKHLCTPKKNMRYILAKEQMLMHDPSWTRQITIICNGCKETHEAEIYASAIPHQINTVYQLCDNCKQIQINEPCKHCGFDYGFIVDYRDDGTAYEFCHNCGAEKEVSHD
ncbi:hypothetical protein EHV15_05270 [Paenibacillus oralis]|uniref:Uncharacterized protein n=1 Tax=Paenibacillus oralis TaxID=2490856 RepID=A0A3P3TWB7_9BACL|nr:hypothetical protein [Paenibacillus oralis]RRJ62425.1 hypothetical protein EHV15_05270 [Paenibacillus oralis]